jgi:hypothetical protein
LAWAALAPADRSPQLIPHLLAAGGGSIVNFGSGSGTAEVGYRLTDVDPDFVVLGETGTYSFTAINKSHWADPE